MMTTAIAVKNPAEIQLRALALAILQGHHDKVAEFRKLAAQVPAATRRKVARLIDNTPIAFMSDDDDDEDDVDDELDDDDMDDEDEEEDEVEVEEDEEDFDDESDDDDLDDDDEDEDEDED